MRAPQFEEPAPTVQAPVLKLPSRAPAEAPRPQPSRAADVSRPPMALAPEPSPAKPAKGPAFWLMLVAAALALLFVGAALGLGAAYIARRMGVL